MLQFNASVRSSERVPPGLLRVTVDRSEFPATRPGQFFLVRLDTARLDPYLRRAWFAPRAAREGFEFWLSSTVNPAGLAPLFGPGETPRLDLLGPLGHPFELASTTRRVLAIGQDALAAAQMLGLIAQSLSEGREVTLVCGHPSLPEFLVPPEVELLLGSSETKSAIEIARSEGSELENWADALVACGSQSFAAQLARAYQGRTLASTGQVLVSDIMLPCGVGACYTCAVETPGGFVLACRAGPVLALDTWNSA